MWVDGMWVPDLIADEVMSAQPYSSGGRIVDIHKSDPTQPALAAGEQTPPLSNPALTVMWVGVATSVAGLALQVVKYLEEKKKEQ